MFKSKRISLLTIFALLLPSVGIVSIGSTAAYASTSTELSVFTVNGTTVTDGETVNLDPYTTSVEVVATAAVETSTVAGRYSHLLSLNSRSWRYGCIYVNNESAVESRSPLLENRVDAQ